MEYKSEKRALERKIRRSDEHLRAHWEKRLKWQKYLLIPFVGRYMRNKALRDYANRKPTKKNRS